jgi:hypothetical protein
VAEPARDQQFWIIEPLLEAGLEVEQITELVFRLSFEIVVRASPLEHVTRLAHDRPPAVQAAWRQAIGRMMTQAPPVEPSGQPPEG